MTGSEIQWKLNEVTDTPCTMDDSGIYTLIHRRKVKAVRKEYPGEYIHIRLDIMRDGDDEPLQSFIGLGNAVRKHTIKWIGENGYRISGEHASYIGYEVCRAMADPNYIQD